MIAATSKSIPRLRRPAILLADDTDAPAIRALVCRQYPYLEACDWTKVSPWWLIAILDERLVGCVQMGASLPIGRLEYLTISPALSHRDRGKVAHRLMHSGTGYLRLTGCSMAQGIVGYPYQDNWEQRMLRRGAVVVVSGDMVAKRLR